MNLAKMGTFLSLFLLRSIEESLLGDVVVTPCHLIAAWRVSYLQGPLDQLFKEWRIDLRQIGPRCVVCYVLLVEVTVSDKSLSLETDELMPFTET